MMKKFLRLIFKSGVKLWRSLGLSGREIDCFYPINILYYFLFRHLKDPNTVINIHGNKLLLDCEDWLGLSIGVTHEPYETQLVMESVKEGDIVVDIGANIG